jgi:hypothetical protein
MSAMTGIEMMTQTKTPDLARFLADIPESGLEPLREQLAERAGLMARRGDDESASWASLYQFMVAEIETARLRRLGIAILAPLGDKPNP